MCADLKGGSCARVCGRIHLQDSSSIHVTTSRSFHLHLRECIGTNLHLPEFTSAGVIIYASHHLQEFPSAQICVIDGVLSAHICICRSFCLQQFHTARVFNLKKPSPTSVCICTNLRLEDFPSAQIFLFLEFCLL